VSPELRFDREAAVGMFDPPVVTDDGIATALHHLGSQLDDINFVGHDTVHLSFENNMIHPERLKSIALRLTSVRARQSAPGSRHAAVRKRAPTFGMR
jgi:hypothetical protein